MVRAVYTEKNDSDVTLNTSGSFGTGSVDLGPGVGSELTWSGDEKSLLVSTSDQGANGLYRTLLVRSNGHGGIVATDLSPLIARTFGQPFKCGWPEPPNVGAVGWTPTGNILVAAEVVHHSNCDSFGTFTLFELDPTGSYILHRFDQLQAKRQFRLLLGQELSQAPDSCVREPRSCWVSSNHNSAMPK
jgi:hypothetical protein